jgi:hypothetical protein
MQPIEVFHREELAKRLADELMSAEGSSGLFITGPRRTGKSTFIREDLIPVLSRVYGTQVVYADLWEDRAANPGFVIVEAIKQQLHRFDGFILKSAKGVGLEKIKVGGLEMTLDHIGVGKGESLAKALAVLAAASRKSITLIVDEAQHSQTTEEGKQALYALKAARDALNASGGPGFRLLATGSSTDKLASLVEDKDQAFYQAPLTQLPTLGQDYLEWFLARENFEPKPGLDAMSRAFGACNHRPEPLRKVFRELKLVTGLTVDTIDARFLSMMEGALARAKENFLQQVNGLNPLEAAVLKVMAVEDKNFAPYTKNSYASYQAFMYASTGERRSDVAQFAVQAALEKLRSEKYVWRAGRGAYLIEDSQHTAWIRELADRDRDEVDRARRELQAIAAAAAIAKEGESSPGIEP